MDLLALIRNQINQLPTGPHQTGLKSVLHHIETAYRHFSRAQQEKDDSLFTDTIYRTNQAFEGSVKEAYRVLAGKNPERTRPYDIEQYMDQNAIFRDRVLSQFRNYRKEWRNPSTHDYNLSFDEAEAFMAMVSVSIAVARLSASLAAADARHGAILMYRDDEYQYVITTLKTPATGTIIQLLLPASHSLRFPEPPGM